MTDEDHDSFEAGGMNKADAEKYRRAAEFVSYVRETQKQSGKKGIAGGRFLSQITLRASNEAKTSSGLLTELSRKDDGAVPASVQQSLFEAFEEMCRRRNISISRDLRPAIYRLLAIELAVNSAAFEILPEKLLPVTLYHGTLENMMERFSEFRDMPWVFRYAAISNPVDPIGFLEKASASITSLEQDERFVEFREMPGLFRRVAMSNPDDPAGALERAQKTIKELERDERFSEFRKTPWMFRQVVFNHPTAPAKSLEKAMKDIRSLENDERFVEFRDTPGVFRQVAITNPTDPAGFLEQVQKAIRDLERDERFAEFHDTPWVFRQVVVNHANDPVGFLEKAQKAIMNLERDDRFAEFRDTPLVFRRAVVNNPSNPAGFLMDIQSRNTEGNTNYKPSGQGR